MDLNSSKCYKSIEKRSTSKFKLQKKIINEIRTVCNSVGKNTVILVILQNLSQLIGLLFLSNSSVIIEIRS